MLVLAIPMIMIIVSSMMLMILINVLSMVLLQVGRNITRAFWDYYKIVAVIPLEVKTLTSKMSKKGLMHFFRTRQTMSAGSRSPLGSCLVGQNLRRSPGASTWIG